uniref:Uncharacterized protein n=1 Tax=Cannabis sativa TaxID=3483 RepID=A0A803QGW3_CANSA
MASSSAAGLRPEGSSTSAINTTTQIPTVQVIPHHMVPLNLRLDRNNFFYWHSQVLSIVRAHQLEGFINGDRPRPPATIVDPSNGTRFLPNPDLADWIRLDQFLLSWLFNSISESMLGHVARCASTAELWEKGSTPIDEYILKMRCLGDALMAAGHTISDDKLILYILGGLGGEYDPAIVNLTSKETVTIQEVQFLLQTQEIRIEQMNSIAALDLQNPTANYAATYKKGPPPQSSNTTRGSRNPNNRGSEGSSNTQESTQDEAQAMLATASTLTDPQCSPPIQFGSLDIDLDLTPNTTNIYSPSHQNTHPPTLATDNLADPTTSAEFFNNDAETETEIPKPAIPPSLPPLPQGHPMQTRSKSGADNTALSHLISNLHTKFALKSLGSEYNRGSAVSHIDKAGIAYSVNKLSQYLKSPTVKHWNACKRILRYIKGTPHLGLHFRPSTLLSLEGYSDADWASSLDDRKSTSGFCVFLGGNLINWSSRKQKAVARSSTESEYRALASAATELVWIHSLLTEIGISLHKTPPVLWCDNQSAQSLALNPVFHTRTKHIELDVH